MTKKVLLLAAFLIGGIAQAQIKPKNKAWAFFELSHQSMLNPIEDLDQHWYGLGVQYSVMGEWAFADPIALGFGLGISGETYQNNMRVYSAPSGREVYTLLEEDSYEYASQSAAYIFLPVELRFVSDANSNGRRWSVHAGVKAGVRITGSTIFENENIEVEYRKIDEMERYRADLYLRLSYGRIGLLAGYAVTPFYSEQRVAGLEPLTVVDGTLDQMRPLTVGLSFAL